MNTESDGKGMRNLVVGGAQLTKAAGDYGGMPLSVGRVRPDKAATSFNGARCQLHTPWGAMLVLNPNNAGHIFRKRGESRYSTGPTNSEPEQDTFNAGDGPATRSGVGEGDDAPCPAISTQPLLSDKSPCGASEGIAETAGRGATEPDPAPISPPARGALE